MILHPHESNGLNIDSAISDSFTLMIFLKCVILDIALRDFSISISHFYDNSNIVSSPPFSWGNFFGVNTNFSKTASRGDDHFRSQTGEATIIYLFQVINGMNSRNLWIKLMHVFDTIFRFSYVKTAWDKWNKINKIKNKK